MRILIATFPVYNHRLGIGYIAALLRARGHEVIYVDFEHILRLNDEPLSLRLQDDTEVYGEIWAQQIQFLHRPELLFAALWPDDEHVSQQLSDGDRDMIVLLRRHVERWVTSMAQLEPGIVLLPALVSNLWIVLWVSALFHECAPYVTRILGGRGISYREVQELMVRARWADALLPGEAEVSIVALADALESGRGLDSIVSPGLVRMGNDGVVWIPNLQEPIDLAELPLPDFSGLPFPGTTLRYYTETNRDFHDAFSLAASRWCPRHCAYCYESIYPKNYRLRFTESVLDEIQTQYERLGTPRLFFCDSTLNASVPWLAELAVGMQRLPFQPQVVFAHCEPRRLDHRTLENMRAAGFEKVNFGVESLDERTLTRMERHTSVEETEDTLVTAVEAGVSLGLNLIANYPGETLEEYESTMARAARFTKRLRTAASGTGASVRFMVSQARVDPHSSLFVNRNRFGLRVIPRELAIPDALSSLEPEIRRTALRWEDGLPEEERQTRFRFMRHYFEGLSISGRRTANADHGDTRIAIDSSVVPSPLAALIPELHPERLEISESPR